MKVMKRSLVVMNIFLLFTFSLMSVSTKVQAAEGAVTLGYNSKIELTLASNPELDCAGSGEKVGAHPGWSSTQAINLTLVDIGNSNYGLYWCPAAAPTGRGEISYTVTEASQGTGCETTATYCAISGVTEQTPLWIMATDATGSYPINGKAIQNSGQIISCHLSSPLCNSKPELLTKDFMGGARKVVADCTFTAVANWEKVVLGTPIDTAQVTAEFSSTGGDNSGLTDDQVFSYWKQHGIGGVHLGSVTRLAVDPVTLAGAIGNPGIKAVIAQLSFSAGQRFAGSVMSTPSFHWVVIDGVTPVGPLAVSWGKTVQMTWQQWNVEAVNMWNISAK